jgi:AcrR family transcriptional regulator
VTTSRADPTAGGRPRNPELDRAILDAVLELLGEEGYGRMSIESVAQRAGVGKPTIYRRWRSKQEMVIDALNRLNEQLEAPAEGTVRERLTGLLEQLVSRASRSRADRGGLLPHLIGEMHRSPELRDAVRSTFVAERRGRVTALLHEGVERGEIAPAVDVEVAADMLLSPLLARKLVTGAKVAPPLARALVDLLFDGCAPRR